MRGEVGGGEAWAAKDTLTSWGQWTGVARRAGVHSIGDWWGEDIGPAGHVRVTIGSVGGFTSGGYSTRGERNECRRPRVLGRGRPDRLPRGAAGSQECAQQTHLTPPHWSPPRSGMRRGVWMGREVRAGVEEVQDRGGGMDGGKEEARGGVENGAG